MSQQTSPNVANLSFQQNSTITIPIFSNDDDEDVAEWMKYFETSTIAMGWTDEQRFIALPGYLAGTARKWYNFIDKFDSTHKPKTFAELRARMVKDLCAAGYRQYLSKQLHNARQQPGQSTAAFIYEMQELCQKISEEMPESVILMLIRERLLPQIQHDITFQNPRDLVSLLDAARTAERAIDCLKQPPLFTTQCSQQPDLLGTLNKLHECMHTLTERLDQNQPQQRCNFCGKIGHIEMDCRRKQRYRQGPTFINTPPYTNYPFMTPAQNYPNFNPNQQSTSGYNQFKQPNPPTMNAPMQRGEPNASTNATTPKETISRQFKPTTVIEEVEPPKRKPGRPRSKSPQTKRKTYVKCITKGNEVIYDYTLGELEEETPSVQAISSPISYRRLIRKTINVNKRRVDSMLDTGSEISLITISLVKTLGLQHKRYKGPTPFAANGEPLPILGEINLDVEISDGTASTLVEACFHVVKTLPRKFNILLGHDILKEAKISIDCETGQIRLGHHSITENLIFTEDESSAESNDSNTYENTEQSSDSSEYDPDETADSLNSNSDSSTEDLITNSVMKESLVLNIHEETSADDTRKLYDLANKYRNAFAMSQKELGHTNLYVHKIDTGDSCPITQAPYRQSEQKREITRVQVEELLRDGIIRESFSPWSSPVVLVSKKGGEWRMCVDYRKINAVTKKDSYPIPDINTSLDALQGSCIFSLLDLRSGYHQVELNKRDRQKTAFTTSFGLYEYQTMPFGLCNDPATFQRLMDVCLGKLKYNSCLVYIDDIIIFSKTMAEHFYRLQ